MLNRSSLSQAQQFAAGDDNGIGGTVRIYSVMLKMNEVFGCVTQF